MHQAQLASFMYMADYDEFFMPVNHRPGALPNSRVDRTWVQLILPYARSFAIFTCPSDSSVHETPETTFDQDLVPGDIYSKYYTASMHVNMGYNYLYLSPIVFKGGKWISEPRAYGAVEYPSKTLLFVDSVWDRLPSGTPDGGGNWIVVPPCRYTGGPGPRIDSFDGSVFSPFLGWKPTDPKSARLYGNAWPWHSGRINIARVDGSAQSLSPQQLIAGCDLRDDWRGSIRDPSEYLWDIH